MSKILGYPGDFVWGTAVAAHQVEGGNVNDWSEWELKNAEKLAKEAFDRYANVVPDWNAIKGQATDPQNYISGLACDHYHRYKVDIAILKSLGIKAFRFSVEWSRIEPENGKFSDKELEHYREVVQELKNNGIEPWITLWHRTNPLWVENLGGWENKEIVGYYLRFAEKTVRYLGDRVKFWMPINEPVMSFYGGYLGGIYPPGKKDLFAAWKVFRNFSIAHKGAYKIIHDCVADSKVGIPHAVLYTEPYKDRWYNQILVKFLDYFVNWKFLNEVKDSSDFIGVQYYSRRLFNLTLKSNHGHIQLIEEIKPQGCVSDMGWEVYPRGLYFFLKELSKRCHKPIYITENGIADAKDVNREQFIKEHLLWIGRAIEEGVNVKGYFYWSLLDNLEWNKGFWPKFGLVEVNHKTFERKIRDSAYKFSEIIKNNYLD